MKSGKSQFVIFIALCSILIPEPSYIIAVFMKLVFQQGPGKINRIQEALLNSEGISDDQFNITRTAVII